MVLTLYKMDASAPCRSVKMVIEALNIRDVKYVEMNLLAIENKKKDFVKINPQYTVPTIVDGDSIIWDSHAISAYLIAKYDIDSVLYPIDPKKRALINMKLHFDSGILYPVIRDSIVDFFFFGADSVKAKNKKKIITAYQITEKFLETSKWLAGDDLTLADICCVASISTLNEIMPMDTFLYPNITAWLDRCAQFEFYKKGNQPGLENISMILKEYITRNSQL